MSEPLLEFIDSRGLALRVDRAAGIIRGVKILGLESQNGRSYLPQALEAAMPLYEGAKVNVNHPRSPLGAPRDYQDRLGTIRNVNFKAAAGLFADLHFNPQHALAGQLAWDAEHAPENVGFSHNVLAKVGRRGDRTVVEGITKVQSVDLVADPATTRGLFEAAAPVLERTTAAAATSVLWEEITAAEVLRRRPDLAESLAGEAARENSALRLQLDSQRAADALAVRRATAERLLAEARLPGPQAEGGWAREIVSDAFFESLLLAPDEAALRRLVEERARLVSAAAGLAAHRPVHGGRPLARDQQLVDIGGPSDLDIDAFVRDITT